MVRFLMRVLFLLAGLVVAASLLVAVMLLLTVWAVRAGWARLTGKPVTPWTMRFDPRAGFERFRAAGRQAPDVSAAEAVNARALGRDAGSNATDVRARPIEPRG